MYVYTCRLRQLKATHHLLKVAIRCAFKFLPLYVSELPNFTIPSPYKNLVLKVLVPIMQRAYDLHAPM